VHLGPAQADQTAQIQILRDVIVKGTDGIAISAVNGDALIRPIEEARAKGIPVVTFELRLSQLKTSGLYRNE
jgi:ribose transport system substrate-binding protein